MKKRNKTVNRAELIIPSVSRNESLSRSFIGAFLMQADPTVEEISDVKCAVSEAVTNSIVHGYRGEKGKIILRASLDDDNVITIDIIDRGCGIEDISMATRMNFTTNTDGERSGMGFTVMKSFTDKMKVFSKVGRGTRVRLIKQIGGSNT